MLKPRRGAIAIRYVGITECFLQRLMGGWPKPSRWPLTSRDSGNIFAR
jgi:hypothetical protein